MYIGEQGAVAAIKETLATSGESSIESFALAQAISDASARDDREFLMTVSYWAAYGLDAFNKELAEAQR